MRRFVMYRRQVPTETHNENQANPADVPQFEGTVFSDGKVAVRWLTACRSVSVWDSFDDLIKIHGHPEYGSELIWIDPESSAEKIQAISDMGVPVEDCYIVSQQGNSAISLHEFFNLPLPDAEEWKDKPDSGGRWIKIRHYDGEWEYFDIVFVWANLLNTYKSETYIKWAKFDFGGFIPPLPEGSPSPIC